MSSLTPPPIEEISKKEEVVPIKVEVPKDSILNRIVPPHAKISRFVTNKDIERVAKEARILYAICFQPMGLYKGAYAMAHPQIDDKDPLQLFVMIDMYKMMDQRIVINPLIIRHSNYFVDSKEGCRTFSDKEQVIVKRWQKIEVEYQTVMTDPKDENKIILSSTQYESLSGFQAFVYQHEFDHLNAKYIYPY